MRQIGGDVAIHENNLAAVQRGFQLIFGFEAVPGIEHGREVGIDPIERAEISIEEFANHFANQESYCGKPVE